jgi:DNA polymerase-3 subunit gamma/tau
LPENNIKNPGSSREDGNDDSPSAEATLDGSEQKLQQLIRAWPGVIEELGKKRQKRLQTFIKEGNVRPCRIEKDNVFLFCPPEYKEIIESGKNIIEDVVKNITGMEIFIKGFQQSLPDEDEKKNS